MYRDAATGVSATSTRWPSGFSNVKVGRSDAVGDPEAVEHLGGEQVVRRQPAKVRGVVARDERLDELEHPLGRNALDRDETVPDERRVGRVDDDHAVGEVVQAHGVEVELSRVCRIAGKEPRMPVARAERGDDAQHPDEELVAGDGRGALRERADVGLEPLARHAPERVGWICVICVPSSRTSSAAVTGAEGRACAAETIATMASDARSRPDIRMLRHTDKSKVTCQDRHIRCR